MPPPITTTHLIFKQTWRQKTPIGTNGSGGISRAFRGICVVSAAGSEPPTDIKCQFSGFSPTSHQTIQRELRNLCSNCKNNCNIYDI